MNDWHCVVPGCKECALILARKRREFMADIVIAWARASSLDGEWDEDIPDYIANRARLAWDAIDRAANR